MMKNLEATQPLTDAAAFRCRGESSVGRVLIAGSTGYLGRHLVELCRSRGLAFLALTRNRGKLENLGVDPETIRVGEVTDPVSVRGCCEGIDTVFSAIGITRQKEGLTYMDVDYRANHNLLEEAKRAGVQRFVYVSALGGERLRHLKIFAAKERFVDELKTSGLSYTILRPNGFFSDMGDFLGMARRGRVFLFGDGELRINPIHGADLASFCLESLQSNRKEIEVGGPDVLSQNAIARLALEAHGRSPRIVHLPDWIRRIVLWLARRVTSVATYGPIEFFLTTMALDNVAPATGTRHLADFFRKSVAGPEGATVWDAL